MKMVIDARESGTSTGRYIDKLVEYLAKLQQQHDIVVLTKSSRVSFLKSIAPHFTIVKSDYKEFTFGEQLGFARQLYKLKADLVHFNAPQQPLLYFGRSVTTVHDLTTMRFNNPAKNWFVFKLKQLVYRFVVYWVAHKSKRLITPSEYVKTDLAKFARVSRSKITVTYEAADKITVKAEPVKYLVDKKFILYVGRPTPHKNLQRLVEAFEILAKDNLDLKLVLVGKTDANYEKLKSFVSDKNLTSQVIFTGFVSEAQLHWLYENAAAYIFPSLSEGFGLPGLEAMAHGAPVVASNATSLPEIYGQAAVYFDPLSKEDIAAKISEVINNSKLKNSLVAKGKAQAVKYSWSRMAKQTLETYQKVIKS